MILRRAARASLVVASLATSTVSCIDTPPRPGGDIDDDDATCPVEACTAGAECLELASPGDATTFTLRVAQASFSAPAAFSDGILGHLVSAGSQPLLPACGVNGSATWNLLFGFDTSAGTMTVASGRPVGDPAGPYPVVDESLNGIAVSPVTVEGPVDGAGAFSSSSFAANLALFFDDATSLVLPLQGARVQGTVSASHACIGAYNADALAAQDCAPDDDVPAFSEGGSLEGFITLEDADAIVVEAAGQSLCVLLGGADDGGFPKKCARDVDNVITTAGDWCASTNQPATNDCADAMKVRFTFAASAVSP